MQEDKIGNSRMVQNGKKTRSARKYTTAVCPEGPADMYILYIYMHQYKICIYVYTSANPCIYMHGEEGTR